MKSFSFNHKHVLVTGAGGGLGSALVRKLTGLGANLVVSDRSPGTMNRLEFTCSRENAIIAVPADLSVPGEAVKLAKKAMEAIGYIDILINNAGIGYHALMDEIVDDKMRKVYEVNTFSPMALTLALLPSMKDRGRGIVINILSCAGYIPTPTTGVYGASKAAFSTMARTLRLEAAPAGVKVFNFYPGPIDTPFNTNALRENKRLGVYGCGTTCAEPDRIAEKVLSAVAGKAGDFWLDFYSKWRALTGTIWPNLSDRYLSSLRDNAIARRSGQKPPEERRWKLWQIESSISCNLNCIMCPWKDEREQSFKTGDMSEEIWEALRPHLPEAASVDFTGGGEPLLHPKLADWIRDANEAGCRTGFLTNGLILNREKSLQFIQAGIDWIGFSMDGATADVYERIRKGADFKSLCQNIAAISGLKTGKKPLIIINYVLMSDNLRDLEKMVGLAADLGVNQINFKQCDVIRGEHGRNFGLFAPKETREIRKFKKILGKACRQAKKRKIQTTGFSFIPDELPVCCQDPRDSLFVRHDGFVAPCINLARGGATTFLGTDVTMPKVHYGRLPDRDLLELWDTADCRLYRERFEQRSQAYFAVLGSNSFEASFIKLNEALTAARKAMPEAPEGCKVCHYLYDI
jgi:short-subunit dehydrogenase/MoaA/NifB/PqqE/SkfB family radical SAM enzyme